MDARAARRDDAAPAASPFPASPVTPATLEGSARLQFRCRPGIACWNACCSNIDIALTPVDIVRLKQRLGLSSSEFLARYTFPYEMEQGGIAGVKLRPVEDGSACRFMASEGCTVYAERPTACRYYPVALLSMRRQDESMDRRYYAIVREEHCLGHQEPRTLTIDEYRQEQGLPEWTRRAPADPEEEVIGADARQALQAQPRAVLHDLLRHRPLPLLRRQRRLR